jgi:hypothetical protein
MVRILGIRHHGPGSARSVRAALESLRPDIVLVEGPPDANDLIGMAGLAGMVPPVALLLYLPDQLQQAVYYPFAEFSPEWQALQYSIRANIPVRFMDLPQAHQLLMVNEPSSDLETAEEQPELPGFDPFAQIAEAAGYSDGERWWEHFVEQRRDSREVFAGILELMSALRSEADQHVPAQSERDRAREASMRTLIRAAQEEGYDNLAVICGAWHAPALVHLDTVEADTKQLADYTRRSGTKPVECTWVPWTYDRLSRRSGLAELNPNLVPSTWADQTRS